MHLAKEVAATVGAPTIGTPGPTGNDADRQEKTSGGEGGSVEVDAQTAETYKEGLSRLNRIGDCSRPIYTTLLETQISDVAFISMCEIFIRLRLRGIGCGKTKEEAEEKAAENVVATMYSLDKHFPPGTRDSYTVDKRCVSKERTLRQLVEQFTNASDEK